MKIVKRFPIVEIDGKRYFRDVMNGEYRNINDPHDRILFDVWVDPWESGQGYRGGT